MKHFGSCQDLLLVFVTYNKDSLFWTVGLTKEAICHFGALRIYSTTIYSLNDQS